MIIGPQLVKGTRWWLAILLFLYTASISAAIPTTITYQGYLTDASGVPETSAPGAVFKLYSQASGGTEEWFEAHTLSVINGFFQVALGSKKTFPTGLFENPVYLGIAIGADTEMTPRLRFGSVPTAFVTEGSVACSSGEFNCNGACADLQTDLANCGTCGTACNTGIDEICVSGNCGIDPDSDGDGFTVVAGGDCNDGDPSIHPGADELCNGIDDNCNEAVDEEITNPQLCPLQAGVCGGATATCAMGQWTTCTSFDYGSNYQDVETSCDNLDNNCDGQTDETFDLGSDLNNCGSCGTACNTPATQCFQPACNGGACENSIDDGTPCGAVVNECIIQDTCSSGLCTDNGFAISGTPCGTGGNCNGSGSCVLP